MARMNHVAGSHCLVELDDVLRELAVPYFLMQGTALGAYRDQGFTPTEQDIDLGFLYEHLAGKIPALAAALLSRGFDVEQFVMPFTRVRTLVVFKEYAGHVVHADLVGMIPWRGWRFTCPPLRDWAEKPYALVHERAALESYQPTVELWGRVFNLPADIDRYLLTEYGADWRTPREDSVSRTRVYNFVDLEGIPKDYLERWP